MARKDLAGLAALGALGMMMNKGKGSDTSGMDTSGVSDIDLTGGARSMVPDTGELRAEDGTMSKLRRNTETGDLYSPNEPITRPSASSKKPSKMASQQFPLTRGPRSSEEVVPVNTSRVSDVDLTGGARSPDQTGGQIARIKNLASTFNVPMRQRLSEDNVPYKKGGVIKMAKGGLTTSSASKRADGIAQKGKTRGKIC